MSLPDESEMTTDHWWWRPGWQVGTRFYAWHVTLDGQDDVHRLADEYAQVLAPFPTLDVIPRQWRHITLQGLGHVQDVDEHRRDRVIDAVAGELAKLPAFTNTFTFSGVFREAVGLEPTDPEPLTAVWRAIRTGMTGAGEQVPSSDTFHAHSSVAYSNGAASIAAIRAATDTVRAAPAQVPLTSVALIRMHRDHRMYEWETVANLSLGGS